MKQVIEVIWHKAASPQHTGGSIVFGRWRQYAPHWGYVARVSADRMPFLSPNQQRQSAVGDSKHWLEPRPHLIVSSSAITELLGEEAPAPLSPLSDVSTLTAY